MERETINEIAQKTRSKYISRRRLYMLFRVYSILGMLCAAFALAYFGLTLLPVTLTSNQQIALTIAGVGIALAAMSRVLMMFNYEIKISKRDQPVDENTLSIFLNEWGKFERISRNILLQQSSKVNIRSPRSVIHELKNEGKISYQDVQILDKALHTRNSLVHQETTIPLIPVKHITVELTGVINKLEGYLENTRTQQLHEPIRRD